MLWSNSTWFSAAISVCSNSSNNSIDKSKSLVINKLTVDTPNGEAPEIKEPTLPEITFSDFDISDGTYGYSNESLAAVGKYSEGVANKSLVGTVNFSDKKSSTINIGGVKSGWEGVKLVTMGSDDSLNFSEGNSRFTVVKINQNDVAVALLNP